MLKQHNKQMRSWTRSFHRGKYMKMQWKCMKYTEIAVDSFFALLTYDMRDEMFVIWKKDIIWHPAQEKPSSRKWMFLVGLSCLQNQWEELHQQHKLFSGKGVVHRVIDRPQDNYRPQDDGIVIDRPQDDDQDITLTWIKVTVFSLSVWCKFHKAWYLFCYMQLWLSQPVRSFCIYVC